jgi:hypothetical protein
MERHKTRARVSTPKLHKLHGTIHKFVKFKGNKEKECPKRKNSRSKGKGQKLYPKQKKAYGPCYPLKGSNLWIPLQRYHVLDYMSYHASLIKSRLRPFYSPIET